MDDYIEREALMKYPIRIDHYDKEHGNEHFVFGIESVIEYAQNIPAADVAEVRHGRWVYGEDDNIQCSICGHDAYTEGDYRQVKTNYCPNCGARMGKEDDHDKHPSDPL